MSVGGVTDFLLNGKEEDRLALLAVDQSHTYGELRSASSAVASYLLDAGGQKGDRIFLVSENSFFWVAAYLGTLQAGMVCVPLPTSIQPKDLEYILQVVEPRFAFLQAGFATKNLKYFRDARSVTDRPIISPSFVFADVLSASAGSQAVLPKVSPDDLAALMFTSGSTGRPRGVMVSHANIMANTTSIIQYLGLTDKDRIMAVLPFHYCFGTSLLHTHLRAGGSLVIGTPFMYPEAVLQRMLKAGCTGFAGVPSHFQILLRNSSIREKTFPCLRYVQQAGGHLAPAFVRELREALPKTQMFVMYGQTEATARLSYLPPEYLDKKSGSIGKGIAGVTLRVLKESGEEVAPGEVGEIVAQGECVARGYWRAPEDSVLCFRDGKLHTGDLATVDEDGFIYIVDRAKDFLKCGGKRISCRQIEERLLEFDALLEAAVICVPDDVLGEAVKVFVVPRMPNSNGLAGTLHEFCKQRMPHELVPKEIVVLRTLPKNSSGKILKQELRSL